MAKKAKKREKLDPSLPIYQLKITLDDIRPPIWRRVKLDDCSLDDSLEIARRLAKEYAEVQVFKHEKNRGKGAALRTGFQHATGEFVGVQDADLEYEPMEYLKLLEPLINDEADVVFGSRYLRPYRRKVLYFWHSWMNRALTFLSNMVTNLDISDMETCYKLFRREIIQSFDLKEDRFGFEPEVVAKIAQRRCRVCASTPSRPGAVALMCRTRSGIHTRN